MIVDWVCGTWPLTPELARLKLFMDMSPKALGSTMPPGGFRGVTGGRLLPGASPCSPCPLLLPLEAAPACS